MSDTHIHKHSWKSLILSKGKWYIFSSLFTKGLSIILLPVYTRYLPPEDFGMLNILNSIGQLFPILISLHIDSAFGRYFHEDKVDHQRLKKLFSTTYWFVVFYGSVVVIISLITAPLWIDSFAHVPFAYLFLTLIPALFMQLGQLGAVYLRQSLDSQRSTLIEVGTALLTIAITLPLLIIFNVGVLAKLIGSMVASAFLLTYYTRYFIAKSLLGFEWNVQVLRRSLIYSLPLLPSVLAGWISGMSDRLILAKYANVEAVGIYSLAASFATILYVIQDAITQVTGPVSMSGLIHDREATLNKIARLSLMLWATMLFADFALVLFSKEIIAALTTKAYIQSTVLIGICAFAYVISPQYRLFMCILSYHKKMWIVTMAGLLSAVVSVVLNVVFIPQFGYFATAWSFVLSTAVTASWIVCWARYYERIPLPWLKFFLLTCIFLVSCWFAILIVEITLVNFMIKSLMAIVFLGVSYFTVRVKDV